MTAVAFDTHAMVKQLLAAGFTDEQAEAVTLAVRNAQGAVSVDLSGFATKADFAGLKDDIAAVRTYLERSATEAYLGRFMTKSDLADFRADIYKAMLAQTVVIVGSVVTLLKLTGY